MMHKERVFSSVWLLFRKKDRNIRNGTIAQTLDILRRSRLWLSCEPCHWAWIKSGVPHSLPIYSMNGISLLYLVLSANRPNPLTLILAHFAQTHSLVLKFFRLLSLLIAAH